VNYEHSVEGFGAVGFAVFEVCSRGVVDQSRELSALTNIAVLACGANILAAAPGTAKGEERPYNIT
jgi:hypothetical protein